MPDCKTDSNGRIQKQTEDVTRVDFLFIGENQEEKKQSLIFHSKKMKMNKEIELPLKLANLEDLEKQY